MSTPPIIIPAQRHETPPPSVLALLCAWCSYAAADGAGAAHLALPPGLRAICVPCTGSVQIPWVVRALESGTDGVLICGCHLGDCHFVDGNTKALGRVALLREGLTAAGFEAARVRLEWVGANEAARFADIAWDFDRTLRALRHADGSGAPCRS